VLSLLGTSLHFSTQTIGLQHTTASNASLFAVTGPITILLVSAMVLSERITVFKVLGIAVAAVGVLVVMGVGAGANFELGPHLAGDLLVLLSIVMWGLFTVFGKRLTDQLGAVALTAAVTVLGALTMIPVGAIQSARTGFSVSAVPVHGWLAIVFLGAGCSFLATLLYFVALERSESQKVGVYLYTIPPMTLAFAVPILGESVSAAQMVGTVLVVAGVALTERG
jgi:drug/metabolite transporter (DMT)-like permease